MSQVLNLEQIFAEFMQDKGPTLGPIVVGVSGGSDSLGLCFIAHTWAMNHDREFWAITVDHGLRAESRAEAEEVGKLLSQHKIQHKILTWSDDRPNARVQELARNARYSLLIDFVKSIGGNCLLVAHHAGDQQETFLMRLMAGSGGDGLASMQDSRELNGCQILRPFLRVDPSHIKNYLKSRDITWIDDPSNKNTKFQRVRIREFLKEEGLDESRIQSMIDKFSQDRDFFKQTRDDWIANNVSGLQGVYLHINSLDDFSKLHKAIAKRVLDRLLRSMSPSEYGIRTSKIDCLIDDISSSSFTGATLNGCQLIKRKGGLHIQREFNKIDHKLPLPNTGSLWDNRIIIDNSFGDKGIVEKLGHDLIPQLKEQVIQESIPSIVWPTLPAVKLDGNILAVPHLGVSLC